MGFLDNLSKKIGNAIEKSAAQNMTGATKEAYEKEKAERAEAAAKAEASAVPGIMGKYEKSDLDNLGALLKKIGAIDESALWIAGFPNFKANQNAFAANLLSGKKNLRFLAKNDDAFYLIKLDEGTISSYKGFRKEDVSSVEAKGGFLTKSFRVELKDRTVYTVDVSENKDKIDQMKNILK
ncbi:MAG: hypothetical protein PHG90_06260 [Clostridia bacterium]|nr:hypothetical protein [Clostridia bacterium]